MVKKEVYKHINFVLAKNIWIGLESKIIAVLIKELELERDNYHQEFREQTITIAELENIFKVEMNTSKIKRTIEKLVSKSIFINSINDKKQQVFTGMPFFSRLEYIKGQTHIKFEFNNAMKPYLLNFRENFVKYNIKNIVKFTSKYSLGIYEICKNDTNFKNEKYLSKVFELSFLHDWLCTPEAYRKIYSNFRIKVLEAIATDITTYSDIALNYKEIKIGRRVVKIELKYAKNIERVENREKYAQLLKEARKNKNKKIELLIIKNKIKKLLEQDKLINLKQGKNNDTI